MGAEITLGAVLLARMSSARMPGKVLAEVAGQPMLKYSLDRLSRCGLDLKLVLATSTDASDDPIVNFADGQGISVFRGSLGNVADRFGKALEELDVTAAFRVNGDSPLINMGLFQRAYHAFEQESPDLVTNIMPRQYPSGVSVELINTASYLKVLPRITESDDREHVTRYMYQNTSEFRIINLEPAVPYEGVHMAIDTVDDMTLFGAVVAQMDRPHWQYDLDELVSIYRVLGTGKNTK